jgi:DNA-binding transcriptional LysR family regulator
MNLSEIQVFAKVADEQRFTVAANRLGITKGAVSKCVDRLEANLGVRLIQRTTRKLSLTEAGAQLLAHIRPALTLLTDSQELVRSMKKAPSGRLRITAPVTFGRMHVVPLIPEFLKIHTDVGVDLVLTDRIVNLTAERFDLAIRQSARQHLGLIARKLVPTRRVLVASPDYLTKNGTPRSIKELTKHQCLSYLHFSGKPKWRFLSAGKMIQVDAKSRFHINNIEAIHQMVTAGMGIAIMPTFIAGPDIASGRLVRILSHAAPLSELGDHVHLVYPQDRYRLPKLTAFVNFFLKTFEGKPHWD